MDICILDDTMKIVNSSSCPFAADVPCPLFHFPSCCPLPSGKGLIFCRRTGLLTRPNRQLPANWTGQETRPTKKPHPWNVPAFAELLMDLDAASAQDRGRVGVVGSTHQVVVNDVAGKVLPDLDAKAVHAAAAGGLAVPRGQLELVAANAVDRANASVPCFRP